MTRSFRHMILLLCAAFDCDIILWQFLFSPIFIGLFLSTLVTLEGRPAEVVPKLQQVAFVAFNIRSLYAVFCYNSIFSIYFFLNSLCLCGKFFL